MVMRTGHRARPNSALTSNGSEITVDAPRASRRHSAPSKSTASVTGQSVAAKAVRCSRSPHYPDEMVTESSPTRRRTLAVTVSLTVVALLLAACGGGSDEVEPPASASAAASAAAGGDVLLDAQRLTVLDQPLDYPAKQPAEVSSVVVQLEPAAGDRVAQAQGAGLRLRDGGDAHDQYDAGVAEEFGAGAAFLEAEDVWLNSTNKGEDAVRLPDGLPRCQGAKNRVERAP